MRRRGPRIGGRLRAAGQGALRLDNFANSRTPASRVPRRPPSAPGHRAALALLPSSSRARAGG